MSRDSFLGLTFNNYGKKYGVISTHLSGPELLEDETLVPNSLIISSPTNGDFGGSLSDAKSYEQSHAMFFTDYLGNAVRLSYTILPGNGLVVNAYLNNNGETNLSEHPYTPDTLTLEIDKDSLKTITTNGQLQVSKPDIIDNYTLMVTQELNNPHTYISVVTANLEKATDIKFGIVRGDNITISANDGILSVNTQNLDYIDDATNTPGIVRPNPDLPEDQYDWRTIEANNGVLRVLTYNLDRATQQVVGVVKPEGVTTLTDIDGNISVRTAGLDKASYENGTMTYGIVRPDNYTIQLNAPGVLYGNAENMTPTRIENGIPHFGVIKLDPISFGIDTANTSYVNRYPEIVSLLDRYLGDYTYIINWLIDHENRITALEHQNIEIIASFINYGTRITELDMPVWDPVAQVVHSEERYYSIQFSIVTNCKFHINIEYQNNVAPGITLYTVKFGDNPPVSGSGLSNYMFESTNMNESTLNFEFLCNNYSSLTNEGNTPTTVFITVSSINDSSVYRTGAHVFNRWNMEWFRQPSIPEANISFETDYEYYTEPDGVQNKNLFFVVPSGDNKYEVTRSLVMNNVNMNSYSFYIIAQENLICKRRKYVRKYVNGIYDSTEESIDLTYNNPITKYIPLGMEGDPNAEYTLVPSLKTYKRSSVIDNINNNSWFVGWEETNSDEERNWVKYYIGNNANNTITTANRIGHNVFCVMSTTPISVNDRRASIKLNINHASGNYESWENTQLNINYIEDIQENNASIFVQSLIPQNTRTNQASSPNMFELNISRTDNVALNNSWTVNVQYCFNTITGNARREDAENTGITSAETTVINTVENRMSNPSQEESIRTACMQDNVQFRRIKVTLPANMSNAKISVKLLSNNTVQVNIPEGVLLQKYDNNEHINSSNINYLIPQSVISHLIDSELENVISGFKIINCTVSGSDLERQNSNSARVTTTVNWESLGTWPTFVQQVTNSFTFGDAYISNIHVYPWDDTEMVFEFTVMAGLMTNIPEGATIDFIVPYFTIYPNVILFNGSQSFEPYDNTVISIDGGWNPMGTKITIRLRNIAPPAPNPNNTFVIIAKDEQQQTQVWDRSSNPTAYDERFDTTETVVYTSGNSKGMTTQNIVTTAKINSSSTRGTDNQTLAQHQTINSNGPMMQNLTGIMFNFVLGAHYNGILTSLYFAASTSLLTSKINITANYANGASKNVNITNALLNGHYYSQTVDIQDNSSAVYNQETMDTLNYMQNKINQISETLNSLTSESISQSSSVK